MSLLVASEKCLQCCCKLEEFFRRISVSQMSEIEKKPSKAWTVTKDLLAGTIGGWTQVLVAQPFDTVKVIYRRFC